MRKTEISIGFGTDLFFLLSTLLLLHSCTGASKKDLQGGIYGTDILQVQIQAENSDSYQADSTPFLKIVYGGKFRTVRYKGVEVDSFCKNLPIAFVSRETQSLYGVRFDFYRLAYPGDYVLDIYIENQGEIYKDISPLDSTERTWNKLRRATINDLIVRKGRSKTLDKSLDTIFPH
ncbi:MAG: hypothetical protein JST90_08570 [Bacteroidetes bacterium]|nr:hypothetical protein [Bacteroidota bacterium]